MRDLVAIEVDFLPIKDYEQEGLRWEFVISSNNYGHLMGSLVVVMPILETRNKSLKYVPLSTTNVHNSRLANGFYLKEYVPML
ncbi:hypothetical protein [Metasolibacillus meyeri]|uniref:hypothetical protein n=1 Tax=Metasolibacillus meyeri TaxID=1071052 RepID=UPI000D31E4D4|nr:hypothetical protein [Metasolibacillus meyeri]